MAVAAETANTYLIADQVPGLAEARAEVRASAYHTMAERQALIDQGNYDQIPLVVDALSTANFVREAEAYPGGKESIEYQERFEGLWLDCRRLVGEWYRKNRPEYFGETTHFFDAQTGDFFSHGISTQQMTENALVPMPQNKEEEARRINERVEDATPLLMQKLGGVALFGATKIRTISECTDKAIDDFNSKKTKGYNGYVPEIKKLMIRDIRLDAETGDRYEEQIGLPGIMIDHWVIQEALRRRGAETTGMDKTELHGTQLLVQDDLIDFVELLDEVASENYLTPVFMGEAVEPSHPRNYAGIRREAQTRQESLANQSRAVALFVLSLAENNVDKRKAPELVEAFVKKMLLKMAEESYELAEQIFDTKTANGLKDVARLRSLGYDAEANRRYAQVEEAAPGDGYCGAGSCGLEAIEPGSDIEKTLQDKLGFGDAKDIIKDTERKCKCGAKTVFYDLKQGKKGCTTCEKTAKY